MLRFSKALLLVAMTGALGGTAASALELVSTGEQTCFNMISRHVNISKYGMRDSFYMKGDTSYAMRMFYEYGPHASKFYIAQSRKTAAGAENVVCEYHVPKMMIERYAGVAKFAVKTHDDNDDTDKPVYIKVNESNCKKDNCFVIESRKTSANELHGLDPDRCLSEKRSQEYMAAVLKEAIRSMSEKYRGNAQGAAFAKESLEKGCSAANKDLGEDVRKVVAAEIKALNTIIASGGSGRTTKPKAVAPQSKPAK